MKQQFICERRPKADPRNIVLGKNYRITFLTDRLVRFEYNESGAFVDEASQVIWYRDLEEVPFEIKQKNNFLEIQTKRIRIRYDEPGDLSSASRFARVAFTKMNAVSDDSEEESVAQFFHILGSVDQQRGCCEVSDGKYEITIYTSCCNASRGIYYYTTYSNSQITAVDMHREDLDGSVPVHYPMLTKQQIQWQN